MTSDNVFGSDQLTPELLRNAAFAEEGGRVDAAEVRIFLDRVASALEVFMSGDAPTALRAEFDRNAAIATQILDAGQTASEQLRRQAAAEAKRILDEARDATLGLRETVEVEIEQARTQVEAMRGTFIQDLRDLYDRIGASLYRFERAAEETAIAPIQEPTRAEPVQTEPERSEAAEAPPAPGMEFRNERGTRASTTGGELPDLPEGAKPPAWQQLPPEAWQATAAGDEPAVEAAAPDGPVPESPTPADLDLEAPAPAPESLAAEVPAEVAPPADPFAPVVEDEPLAPGEPLVDLRSFGSAVDDAATVAAPPADAAPAAAEEPAPSEPANVTEAGGSWLDPAGDLPPVAPQADAQPADTGSWLETPLDPDPPADAPADPALARDDALAQALIGGDPADTDPVADAAPDEPAAPDGAAAPPAPDAGAAPPPFPTAAASPDAVAVRQLILDSLAAGQTREAVEAYLREHMGLLEPGALVDAALATAEQQ